MKSSMSIMLNTVIHNLTNGYAPPKGASKRPRLTASLNVSHWHQFICSYWIIQAVRAA